jgi:hypothetical protein
MSEETALACILLPQDLVSIVPQESARLSAERKPLVKPNRQKQGGYGPDRKKGSHMGCPSAEVVQRVK